MVRTACGGRAGISGSAASVTVIAVDELLERWQRTKPGRAWSRYGHVRGNVLAGGIAYFAFFSLIPALAIGFTVLGLIIGDRLDLQQHVVDYVNSTFGGLMIIGSGPRTGLVSIDQLVADNVLTVVGAAGLIALLITGLGWIGALRDGLSAVFQRVRGPNPALAKLADLGVLVSFGLAACASMAGSVLVTSATPVVLDWLGLGGTSWSGVLVNVLTSLVVLAIDSALFLMTFRLLSGVRLPWEDLFSGALVGGVAFGLLKLLSGLLLRVTSGNRFFTAFVIVAGLLIWMNLAARASLLAAAWAATTAEDRGHLPPIPAPGGGAEPSAVSLASSASGRRLLTVGVHGVPTYSQRAADRTTLLAGAVLGVTAAIGLRVMGRAGGTLRDAVRRPRPDGDPPA